ncbi:MAG: hypothetical protein IT574_10130 [Candidatus Aureabacteria bacterium]|nr:hypothetical protein [Candidatus Auribacterota bacterium]NLW95038.1 hypothetical protein [Chlamydiota bacterium]HOE26372.1 hypothetical protein [bacterium]
MTTRGRGPVVRGAVHLFYCHELAYAVKVDTLERLLSAQQTEGVLSMRRSRSHYLRFENLPLIIRLGEEKVRLRHAAVSVSVQARVFDYGVVSLRFSLPFHGGLETLAALSAELSEEGPFPALSAHYLRKVRGIVAPALHRPIESDLVEDYTIIHVTRLDEPLTEQELIERHGDEIARILRAEERPLSAQETANALSNRISYYPDDLLVVDWDRAFIYDREEHTDHIHIIEFANTQLLEMRYYDWWLDGELDALERDIRREGGRGSTLVGTGVRRLSKRTMLLMAEVVWLTDQIDNSLKAIDTLYAARVHRAIGARLYLNEWKRGLDRKLAALGEISDTLTMRAYNMRSNLLELIIVLLILFEIVMAFVRAA